MKPYILYSCLITTLISCDVQQNVNEISGDNSATTNQANSLQLSAQLKKQEVIKYDFQKISNHIVERPSATQMGLTNKHELQQKVFSFYESGGFAPEPLLPTWKQTVTLEQADQRYKAFVLQKKPSPLLNSYRQYASQVILQDMELLAKDDSKSIKNIAFYTEELLSTNCRNIPLLYYCLEKLNGYWSKSRIQDESKKLLTKYENDPFFNEAEKQYFIFFGPTPNTNSEHLGVESKKMLKESLEKIINEKKIFRQKLKVLSTR
ncbi:MAG: hypothetical protein U0Y10_05710 [Spirosomataceae bacterium]